MSPPAVSYTHLVHFESLQGDVEFLHILEKMGCSAQETENGVLLLPPSGQTDTGTQVPAFHGITVDMRCV